ncbi:MAG: 50S ribosomal protein L7/L12 [Parcubacteria group bacterium]|nr:50S ribosomal protein L7/L12 [Parcubacteria group bacterium]
MSEENTKPVEAEVKTEAKADVKAEVPAKFKAIVDAVEKMSVLDLHELVKFLEGHFGVSAAAVAVAGPAAGAGAESEEKSTFNVELKDSGAQKIAVIKVVKEILVLGLKEAKDLVDAAPSMLKEGMKKEEAEAFKKRIEEAGGKVDLK